jgi:hypothetical protein
MKKEFLPYYISRAILSAVFAVIVWGFTWQALLFAIFIFGLFLLYLHSGWFRVDLTHPLFPLRRDQRGQLVQRKALIAALIVGVFTYLAFSLVLPALSANLALPLAIVTYFLVQFYLLRSA